MFSLTSTFFIWFVRVALVVALVWIVVRWGSAARTTVFSIVRRIMSLIVVMLLAVMNVLAPINAQYGWYTSWGDVWNDITGSTEVVPAAQAKGQDPSASVRSHVGTSPLAGLPTSGRDKRGLSLTPTSYGGYQTFTVAGQQSGYTGQVTMWFPPEYQTEPKKTFPVIEAFHGYLPAPLATFNVFHMDRALQQLKAERKIRLPILVIPHWSPNRVDTECVDGGRPGDPAIETWVTRDIPKWVYENFRVPSGRESWATQGGSAGGWCAMMTTMLHPKTFGAAISLGGYARPTLDPPYQPFGPGSEAWRRYDLIDLAKRKPPAVALWTLTSTPDKESAASTKALTAAAKPRLSITPTVLSKGSHRAEVWEPYIGPSLEWLGRTSPGFAP